MSLAVRAPSTRASVRLHELGVQALDALGVAHGHAALGELQASRLGAVQLSADAQLRDTCGHHFANQAPRRTGVNQRAIGKKI